MSALAIAIGLVIAGGLVTWAVNSSPALKSPAIVDDGPTFYQAYAAVDASVSQVSGGPWVPYQADGVASPTPFSPNAMWVDSGAAMNDCGAAFDGVTLWNGTIPLFTGTADSGTAPFWQFAFYSNSSSQIEVATDTLGLVRIFNPIGVNSSCAYWGSLLTDDYGAKDFSPMPADSPTMAASAWDVVGQSWMERNHVATVIYAVGSHPWNGWPPAGFFVVYYRCGMVGVAGTQPELFTLMNKDGTWNSYDNGTITCTAAQGLDGRPVPYKLNFSTPTQVGLGNTTLVELPFLNELVFSASNQDPDAWGLVSWMATFNLTNTTGTAVAPAGPICSAWVSTLADCRANVTGWYVVLLSSAGEWLDAYGAVGQVANWTIPDVSIVSGQVMVVVTPSAWDSAEATLSVGSTTTSVILTGSSSVS